MSETPLPDDPARLRRRREEIRRELGRVWVAAALIVGVLLALAVTAVVAGWRASRHEAEARDELWKSYLAQATAGRLSGVLGRKASGMAAVEAGARIRPSTDLRSEFIAHAALIDLVPGSDRRPMPPPNRPVMLHPREDRFATTDADGAVVLWPGSGDPAAPRWTPTNGVVSLVLWSPDGRWIVAGTRQGTLHLLEGPTLRERWSLGQFRAVDFTPDSSAVGIVDREGLVRFADPATGTPLYSPLAAAHRPVDLTFHPSTNLVALQADRDVELWDWRAGRRVRSFVHATPITSLALAGNTLAVGDGHGELEIFDLVSGHSRRLGAHRDVIHLLRISHRGDLLMSGSYDGFTRCWDPVTGGGLLATTRGFPIAFSDDDTRLACIASDGSGWVWDWWSVSASDGVRNLGVADGGDSHVWHAQFAPDSRSLAVMKGDGLRILDYPTGRLRAFQPMARARSVFFLGPDRVVTCGDYRVAVWAIAPAAGAEGPASLTLERAIALPASNHVDSAGLSRDGRRMALPITDSRLVIVDLEGKQEMVSINGASFPKQPAFSPDGRWLVTGTFHGEGSVVWDAATGQRLRHLAPGNASPVFSPDGRLLVLCGEREYQFYDPATWTCNRTLPTENSGDLSGMATFSHDGRLMAVVKQRNRIELVDPATARPIAALTPPDLQTVTCLAFTPDDTQLAVGTPTDRLLVWDLGHLRQRLAVHGLDWGSTTAGAGPDAGGDRSSAPAGALRAVGFVGVAVVVGFVCAGFVLIRQRRLIAAYLEVDRLIEQRDRALETAHAEILHVQKMQALGTLAAGVAHDFNNLLSVIRMSNKLIAREAAGVASVGESVADIEEAVRQGKQVVQSMLGHTRHPEQEGGRIPVPDVVDDMVGLLSKQFLSEITLDLDLQSGTPPVTCSRGRLEQVLLNLVVNASEAMKGTGRLRIAVDQIQVPEGAFVLRPRPAAGYVRVTLADTGPGIPPEVLPRIFEPFFTTKTMGTTRGTGLGLSMVYSIAQVEGLGLAVETAMAQGTRFYILIPAPADSPAQR